tara:strand:+ start:914 stop:2155 length:1242 start_codon:yes stop_codon:yes gene_type:complete
MGFLSKIRNNMRKRVSRMPRRPGMIRDMRFRGRMPQKRSGFGFGLGEAIRRLNRRNIGSGLIFGSKQQRMMPQPIPERMPINRFKDPIKRPERMPSMDDGRVYAGGSPGLYKPGGRFYNPEARLQMPQPIPRAEIDISALEPLPMGDMPMTQDLPEVSPVGMMAGRTLQQDFPAERRMMMSTGDEVFMDSSPEQIAFSIGVEIDNLEEQLRLEKEYSPEDYMAGYDTRKKIIELRERQQKIMQTPGFDLSEKLRIERNSNKELYDQKFEEYMNQNRPQLAGGGEAFPDLSGDGETTFKDVLIGRGVDLKAEGGEMMTQENEIDAMLGGMDSEESGAMEDLEQMAPEMEMIDQLVTMVVQMIQQGASEEEVMMFLREQGLDDEDIGTVLQLVAEMAEAEAMPQDGIGAELEQLA